MHRLRTHRRDARRQVLSPTPRVDTKTNGSSAHVITLALKEPVPEEVDAGTDFSLVVTIAAPSDCDLRAAPFQVIDSDRVILSGELPTPTSDHHETAEITVTAPAEVAAFTWTFVIPAVIPAREVGDVQYEGASLDFSFRTRPHATSLAVWDNPSPVGGGERFSVKVGAKCAVGCALVGKEIDIHDESGARVGSGVLSTTPWPGTTALYWTPVDLQAPAGEGRFDWTLAFSGAEVRLPHEGASASFGFVTTRPPEHTVSVTVVEKNTDRPVHDVQVRLGVHRMSTDETGLARFAVPTGEHRLFIWKAGYDAPERTVRVIKPEEVRIEMTVLPEEDPFAFWQG